MTATASIDPLGPGPDSTSTEIDSSALSLVRNDLLIRAQRAVGLAPAHGLGVARRALFFALVTWVPLALWAAIEGLPLRGGVGEPLSSHFGIHVRCLVAIPLLVVAEGVSHAITTRLVPEFVHGGFVAGPARAGFVESLTAVARLRDRAFPWVVLAGLLAAVLVVAPAPADNHELAWAVAKTGGFGFGGFWFTWVIRPVFTILLLAWLWRLILAIVLSARLARLDLALAPTHPDGAAGLGFLEALPIAFSPVILAISTVLASRWSHDVLYHGVHVETLRMPMIAFGVTCLVLFLAPLLPWLRVLAGVKRRAELEYGALVAEHGRLVRRRWIEHARVEDEAILSAPEIGPVADTLPIFESVRKMHVVPIGRRSLAAILLPAALPQLAVIGIEVPVKELLLGLLKALA
ncbi:MAG: hypothetical protein R3F35_08030 [Myxococcota bacterium]